LRFVLFLARTLGRTVAELGGMTSYEYALWRTEYAVAPWGDWQPNPGPDDPMEFAQQWQ